MLPTWEKLDVVGLSYEELDWEAIQDKKKKDTWLPRAVSDDHLLAVPAFYSCFILKQNI